MGKSGNFIVGTLIGVAIGAVVAYLFGPAQNTRFDATYQSRLDRALDEGRLAEEAKAEEMRREFAQAKKRTV
jgi:gas vesicle protein